MGFAPRRVVVGNQTEILLHPHIGEFDFEALFTADMSYEREIFGWLEKHAPESYDTIVEIGANVGIYTVFFDRLSRKPGSNIRRILAFEPAHEPYRRLLQNSLANEVSLAQTYPIAISDRDGFVEFYQPEGHLTNGSLLTEYAGRYGAPYTTNLVPALAACHLETIFKSSQKVLLKIDVEGYEPHLLAAMRDLLQRYRPHLIIEVLRKTADPINECLPAATYEIFSIRDTGLVTVDRVAADPAFRDYFLKPFLPDLS
jgi:FkbM family methyltransferase